MKRDGQTNTEDYHVQPISRKFDLKSMEEEVLAYWKERDVYEAIRERERERPVWRFIDGPPYTTGAIHLGTAWNKILKDVVMRYKRMRGFRVTDTPGYDTHGLPIEVVMEKRLGIKNKQEIVEFGVHKFIKECRKYAESMAEQMHGQFQRLGCAFWAWDRPYITLKNSYIEGIWWTLKRAWEKGLLYKYYKPQNCCPRCATALAKHEFDYKEIDDISIYVKFKSVDWEDTWFVIWTTTPWTLVANEAIMAHPLIEYVKADVTFPDGHHEFWVLSKASSVNLIVGEMGLKFEVVETFLGERLEGKRYVHPLVEEVPYQAELAKQCDKVHTIVLSSEYVSEGEGVGLVHTAPGHGPEDFEVGVANGIPVFNPVKISGIYSEQAGEFAGKYVFDANDEITEILRQKGTLLLKLPIKHEYAHCWRCESKLVYRATEQWFFRTTALIEDMLKENEQIYWVPEWAGNRWFSSWLANLRDWCISRQRFWGIPLSVWVCDDEQCGDVEVIGSAEELRQIAGTCPEDLHRPWIDKVTWACKKCGRGTKRRIHDILDVWLDSGSVMWAAQEPIDGVVDFENWKKADFILEGKDQIRGWFNSLLCSAMVSSRRRNYDACYMHGWVTSKGVKMSKSLGNSIEPYELIDGSNPVQRKNRKWSKINGIETFRFYSVGGAKPGLDLNFDWKEYTDTFRVLNTLWNTCVFLDEKLRLLGVRPDLEAFRNNRTLPGLTEMDRWMMSRVHGTIREVTEAFERYELPTVPKVLRDFLVNDLSRWYIASIRDRVTESAPKESAQAALTVLTETLWHLMLTLAPLNPMLTETLYLGLFRELVGLDSPSIHLLDWPEADEQWMDPELERQVGLLQQLVEANRTLRAEAKLKLKWPLPRMVVVPKDAWAGFKFERTLEKLARVNQFVVADVEPSGKFASLELPTCHVFLDLSTSEELVGARVLSDLSRAIQFARKKNNYRTGERIELVLNPSSDELARVLEKNLDLVKKKVTATKARVDQEPPAGDGWVVHVVLVCPNDECRATIKPEVVQKAKKSRKKVRCFYCGGEFEANGLESVTVHFKRAEAR
ncbi:MAG: isoleucine--tRNA ligase [Promethearchaeota archaeon]